MRNLTALLASFLITGTTAVVMLAIGGNALVNKNTVPMSDSPAGTAQGTAAGVSSAALRAGPSGATADTEAAQLNQLTDLIKQYQQREQQYQSQLDQVSQQLSQASSQIQSYQQLLLALQSQGVIVITQDGRILIPRG